jgi:hypothetical protein
MKTSTKQVDSNISWDFCPECGSEEHTNDNLLGDGFRFCAGCGQEWWTDIDYSSVVVKNIRSEIASDELVKRAQALGLKTHNYK